MPDEEDQLRVIMSATSEEAVADRLTLISQADCFELEQPVFVQKGERYWADRHQRSLVVEDSKGRQRSFVAKPAGADTPR